MSPKELLYIDDALGHATQMKAACTDFASKLQDPELKTSLQASRRTKVNASAVFTVF